MKLAELLQAIESHAITKIDSRELDITLDDAALSKIAEELEQNKSITEIHIESNAISEKGVSALCDSLKAHEQILTLSLSGIKDVSTWIHHLIETLKSNKTIEVLKLNNNQIKDEDLDSLNKILAIIFSLKHIYLENNQITDNSVAELVKVLKYGHHLTLLSLKGNQITDKGAAIFADYLGMTALKQNIPLQFDPALTQLFLDNNAISDAGIEFFANALKENRFLLTLSVLGNLFSEKSASYLKTIADKLADNKLFSQQFEPINNFKKIGPKPGGSESPGAIYLKLDDNTKWLIKLTYGNGNLGSRIGTIQEYIAGKLIHLLIPDYPSLVLIVDGGQFKVGCRYIDNLEVDCNKFDTNKFIKYLFESYLMCYVFADADVVGNRWFYETADNIIFYKGDLGMAFYFNQDNIIQCIDIDAIPNAQIAKFFDLPIDLVNKALNNEIKIQILEQFSKKITDEEIEKTVSEMKLLGKYGDENIKILCQRADDCRLAIPGLIRQLQNPNIKFAPLIQPLKVSKTLQNMKEEEEEEESKESSYQPFH